LVVSDPANPDNEGKTFLYKYGKKIFDKIMDVMQPQFQDEKAVNPFDFWEGANFKLKIRTEQWRNYDKSEFDGPSPLFGGDEDRLREIYDGLYKLSEFTDESSYKSYDDLKSKLIQVLGAEEVNGTEVLTEPSAPTSPKVQEEPEIVSEETTSDASDDDDDDSLSYFAQLAKS